MSPAAADGPGARSATRTASEVQGGATARKLHDSSTGGAEWASRSGTQTEPRMAARQRRLISRHGGIAWVPGSIPAASIVYPEGDVERHRRKAGQQGRRQERDDQRSRHTDGSKSSEIARARSGSGGHQSGKVANAPRGNVGDRHGPRARYAGQRRANGAADRQQAKQRGDGGMEARHRKRPTATMTGPAGRAKHEAVANRARAAASVQPAPNGVGQPGPVRVTADSFMKAAPRRLLPWRHCADRDRCEGACGSVQGHPYQGPKCRP